jgi:3-methylcrotonyl-CoA carboxylase alpha subunit
MQAPMMGKIVSVNKAIGSQVKKGETLVMIESMKMELHVKALFDGTLEEILCKVGDMVERRQILAIMAPNLH